MNLTKPNPLRTLNIVVEVELVGMRAQRDLLVLLIGLILDIGLNQVFREDAALQQVLMIFPSKEGTRFDSRGLSDL